MRKLSRILLFSFLLLLSGFARASFFSWGDPSLNNTLAQEAGSGITQNSASIEAKLRALTAQAANVNASVLKMALRAYEKAKARGMVQKPLLTVVDYTKPSTEPRLTVVDLQNNTVPFQLRVAHGKNSGDYFATRFSNRMASLASSLGVFVTGGTYVGKNGYSLRLDGLEPGINDNAAARAIVVHGSRYVSENQTQRRVGRSWGCFAVDSTIARSVINTIKGGSLIFAYYPDKQWLSSSEFLRV